MTPASVPKYLCIIKQGQKVFKKSRNKVINPNFFPINLLTLVAPILPEP